jgi:anti-sigma B factor antagonist
MMEFEYREEENGIRLVKLVGRLDILGVSEVESKFAEHSAGGNVRLVVDLSDVDFLASIGIRLLTLTAKSVASRDGKMVLVNPVADVRHVLEITGIPGIIPLYPDPESATTALLSSSTDFNTPRSPE